MRRWLKRLLIGVVAFAVVVAIAGAVSVWLIAHDDVARLRLINARTAGPLAPALTSAILAAEDPALFQRPRFSLRSFLPPSRGTRYCGPSPIAFVLVRTGLQPRRPLLWHIEAAVATYVVASVFDPDELLRIYAHELYLGTVNGHEIRGLEAASTVYFGKDSRDLTVAEAAMLGAMIRSPNVFSPVRHPARAMQRRNAVLERMLRLGLIDQGQFKAAVLEPLTTPDRRLTSH